MKHFLKGLGKGVGTVLALALVLALLPYASGFLSRLLPDPGYASVRQSVVLSERLRGSARLETNQIDTEAVLQSSTTALLVGTVQSVEIAYAYHASVGIDRSKVQVHVRGNTITLELPELEILSDSLTPTAVSRDDFWYPLTDERRQKLLDSELQIRRETVLASMSASEEAWQNTVEAIDNTIAQWISLGNNRISIEYARPASLP